MSNLPPCMVLCTSHRTSEVCRIARTSMLADKQTDRQIDLVLANSYNCTQVKWESSTLSWKQHHWPIYSPGLYLFSGRPCLSPNRPCPLLFYWTPPNKITCPFSYSSSHSTTSFSHALPSLKKTVCFIQIFVVICPYWYAYTLKNKGF